MLAGIGQTQAQGQIASQQAQQQGTGNLLGLASAIFSDERLKENIEYDGHENGIPKFTWTWNSAAKKLGLTGKGFGTIAQMVIDKHPEAVSVKDGFYTVDYNKLGVSHG